MQKYHFLSEPYLINNETSSSPPSDHSEVCLCLSPDENWGLQSWTWGKEERKKKNQTGMIREEEKSEKKLVFTQDSC